MNEPHQFIFREDGYPVIVTGPRHTNNDQGEGSFSGRVNTTIDRSDPNRLLVTFSGLVYKRNRIDKQGGHQGDEGKDVHSSHGGHHAGEVVTFGYDTEDVEMNSLYEDIL